MLPDQMRAVVIAAPHQVELCDVPVPSPGPGEALVKIHAVGLCGSDLHAYEGTQPFFRYPQVPGHEIVGEVVALSSEPSPVPPIRNRARHYPVTVGSRVTLDPAMPCGHCYPCRRGRYNCCVNLVVFSVHAPGALAEYAVAPLACLHVVPGEVDDDGAVLVEPLSIGIQAAARARLAAGEKCLIIGAGAIGLSILLVARSRGAVCALSDPIPERLETAAALGADLTVNPTLEDLLAVVGQFTGGEGPPVVFEAVGLPLTIRQAAEVVAASGRVVQLGLCRDEVCFPGSVFVRKELDWLGSRLHTGTVPQAVALIASGAVDPRPLISHRMRLEETGAALRLMAERPQEVTKIVLRP